MVLSSSHSLIGSSTMNSCISIHFLHGQRKSTTLLAPMDGFIAQLVERCTGYAKAMASISFEAQFVYYNCITAKVISSINLAVEVR